jgi:hypothetical protein
MNSDLDDTPDTPTDPIQELRNQQTNTMLSVLATMSNIPGITLDEIDWPYLPDCEHGDPPQRYRATVTFWVP